MKFETHVRKVCFEWNFSSGNFENVLRFFGQNVSFRSLFIFWISSNLSFLTQKFRTQCQLKIEIKWSENSKVKVQMWRRIDFGIRWQLEFVLFFLLCRNSKFKIFISVFDFIEIMNSLLESFEKKVQQPCFYSFMQFSMCISLLFDLLTHWHKSQLKLFWYFFLWKRLFGVTCFLKHVFFSPKIMQFEIWIVFSWCLRDVFSSH